jgi:hypothetical protein
VQLKKKLLSCCLSVYRERFGATFLVFSSVVFCVWFKMMVLTLDKTSLALVVKSVSLYKDFSFLCNWDLSKKITNVSAKSNNIQPNEGDMMGQETWAGLGVIRLQQLS